MSEIGIQISVPCGPEGAAILSALAKAFAAPNPDLSAAQDHLAHTAAVNTHMLPQIPSFTPPVLPPLPPITPFTPPVQASASVTPSAPPSMPPAAVPQQASASVPVAPPVPPAGVPTAVPDYTHEQLHRAAAAFLDKSPASRPQLFGLLQQFGVPAITSLTTPEARTSFAAELRKLGVQI